MPSYQADAVTSFLTNHPPPFTAAQFNNSGTVRGFPDLSANGCAYLSRLSLACAYSALLAVIRANYIIGIDGAFNLVFGTSASSPVVGSLITLINDARLAAGKGPVGFINPSVHTIPHSCAQLLTIGY